MTFGELTGGRQTFIDDCHLGWKREKKQVLMEEEAAARETRD